MLVYVKTQLESSRRAVRIPLWLPTVLLVNHVTVTVAWVVLRKRLRDKGVPLRLGTVYRMLHALWRCKLRFPLMPLVAVDTSDGTRVRFKI